VKDLSPNGETIVLGGLIRTKKTKSVSGVPVLKDVPGLGALFRSTSENPTRVELIVLIRPTVLKTPELASIAARTERAQSPTIRGVEQIVREADRKEDKRIDEVEQKARKQALEDSSKASQRSQQEEIDALHKKMLQTPRGQPVPAPTTPEPQPDTQQKSIDFLRNSKPANP